VVTVENIKKAAEKGDADAQFKLGNIYMSYFEDTEDEYLYDEAINWFKASAKKKMFQHF
jgi:TPR repeat protein